MNKMMMNNLEMFKNCQTDELRNAEWLEVRVVKAEDKDEHPQPQSQPQP